MQTANFQLKRLSVTHGHVCQRSSDIHTHPTRQYPITQMEQMHPIPFLSSVAVFGQCIVVTHTLLCSSWRRHLFKICTWISHLNQNTNLPVEVSCFLISATFTAMMCFYFQLIVFLCMFVLKQVNNFGTLKIPAWFGYWLYLSYFMSTQITWF